jgi:hypothetical protein
LTESATAEVWKLVAVGLFGAAVSGIGTWMTLGPNLVRRVEMQEYVQTYSPWAIERGEIKSRVATLVEMVRENQTSLNQVRLRLDTLVIENAKQTAELQRFRAYDRKDENK